LGLTVTVSHYPPGISKWNPIEHRLFSQISRNRAGEPLTDIDKALNFIRTTTTKPGLVVTAQLIANTYNKGIKILARQKKSWVDSGSGSFPSE
jgi:Rhodopirellula transposase DDE domain